MTWLRKCQQQQASNRQPPNQESEASLNNAELTPAPESADTHDLLFTPAGLAKPKLTRAQKREIRR